MTWRNPESFFLIVPMALLAIWFYRSRGQRRGTLQLSSKNLISGVPKTWRVTVQGWPDFFKLMSLLLVVIALARPQESSTKTKRNVEGIDIVITLDISDSMLIEDMKPKNRLESAKKTIKEFIQNRVSDKIGIVVFSGESYTRVPPTLDYKILLESVEQIETSRNLKMGTAIGVALANSTARLKDSTAKSRVIILMTDGENNSGTIAPETALEIAKGYDLRVYTIGMGVDGDAQLPVFTVDAFGNTVKRYQPIHSTVNDELLSTIANQTGGKYYRASTGKALENVFKDINRLEKTKIEVNQYTRYTELFPKFLWPAVLMYMFSLFFEKVVLRRVP